MNLEKKDWSRANALKKTHKQRAYLAGKILTRKEKNGRGEWI
jgi:hypothetical protein